MVRLACLEHLLKSPEVEITVCKVLYAGQSVVVAQLAERSLPTQEVRGSKPVIAKLLYKTFVYCQNCIGKTFIKVVQDGTPFNSINH